MCNRAGRGGTGCQKGETKSGTVSTSKTAKTGQNIRNKYQPPKRTADDGVSDACGVAALLVLLLVVLVVVMPVPALVLHLLLI